MKVRIPMSCCAALSILIGGSALAAPLGTGFTYQGQLYQSGTPVNGPTNLRFSLWDAPGSGSPPVGGTQIGTSQLLTSVPVTNGLFVVQVNDAGAFGPNGFKGGARWLQIEVCSDPACTTPTALSPRQPVTAAPYALYALNGSQWINDANGIDYAGRVGIGGPAIPTARLDISSNSTDVENPVFIHTANPTYAALAFGNTAGGPGLDDAYSSSHTLAGKLYLGAGLDVRGDIKLGSSRQFYAPASEENLRIMRGYVRSDGVSLVGCCYAVTRQDVGRYRITFTTAFSGIPVITVTTDNPVGAVIPCTVLLDGNGVTVLMRTPANTGTDAPFSFIVIGPR